MRKTKAFQLLQTFSKWELIHLDKFLNSPFFNKREDVISLFNFLIQEKEKKKSNLSKENTFSNVYPNGEFDQKKLYLLISYLFKLMEQFLAFREMSNNKSLFKLYLGKAYRQKQQPENFQRVLKEGKRILKKQPLRDRNYLRELYDFDFEHYDFIDSKSGDTKNTLQELADSFDVMYIAEKLKQFCFQVSHQNIINKDYTSNLGYAILQLLEEKPQLLEFPAIHIYYLCYQVTTSGEEKYFHLLRKVMDIHSQNFTTTELRNINLLAINFCIKRMNSGVPEYIREGFELYRSGLKVGLLLENGEISRFTFNNVSVLGIKIGEFDWVEDFIKEYRNKLPIQDRKSIYQYQLAKLRYEQKRYKEAMQLLATFNSKDDYLINLAAKYTLMKIYYELNELNSLEYLIDSTRTYLRRKDKLAEHHKKYYKDIIKLFKRLINLRSGEKAKSDFKERVMLIKVKSVRDWFLEQIEKL